MAVNGVDNQYSSLGLSAAKEVKEAKDPGSLGMEEFLSLMTNQLKNQDPLKPMDNGEFLGQIASFATVSGIGDLNKSFDGFSTSMQSQQALQGSSLVGRSVLVPSSIGNMTNKDGLKGQVSVAAPVTNLKVDIYNEQGVIVKTLDIGKAAGYTDFEWDGLGKDGKPMPEGLYQFKATGTVEGKNTVFATATIGKVDSVIVGKGSNGLTVNLAGIGSVPFKEVQEILGA